MQAKQFIFHNLLKILMVLLVIGNNSVFANSYNEVEFKKKMEEIQKMEKRKDNVRNYLAYLERPSKYEKSLLKEAVDYKIAIYLASDSKKTLKKLSPKVFDNTMCLAQKMGNSARVYLAMMRGFVFETEKEKRRYERGRKYLETLETPDYSQDKINRMCKIEINQ